MVLANSSRTFNQNQRMEAILGHDASDTRKNSSLLETSISGVLLSTQGVRTCFEISSIFKNFVR